MSPIAKGGLTFYHPELADQFLGAWNYAEDKTFKTAIAGEAVLLKGIQYWLVKPT